MPIDPEPLLKTYNKYLVTGDIPMKKGEIAPWFGTSGGGIQYQIQDDFYTQMMSYANEGEGIIDVLKRLGYLEVVS